MGRLTEQDSRRKTGTFEIVTLHFSELLLHEDLYAALCNLLNPQYFLLDEAAQKKRVQQLNTALEKVTSPPISEAFQVLLEFSKLIASTPDFSGTKTTTALEMRKYLDEFNLELRQLLQQKPFGFAIKFLYPSYPLPETITKENIVSVLYLAWSLQKLQLPLEPTDPHQNWSFKPHYNNGRNGITKAGLGVCISPISDRFLIDNTGFYAFCQELLSRLAPQTAGIEHH
jgi:hypothetical protein